MRTRHYVHNLKYSIAREEDEEEEEEEEEFRNYYVTYIHTYIHTLYTCYKDTGKVWCAEAEQSRAQICSSAFCCVIVIVIVIGLPWPSGFGLLMANALCFTLPPPLSSSSSISSLIHRSTGRPLLAHRRPSYICCSVLKRPQYIPNKIHDPNYVRIFDTTLRDGEQSPGATLTSKEKLDIARQLAKLGVDVIEAGFPVASPDDLEAVKLIAKEVGNNVSDDGYVPVICGLARCNKADIDAAWEAVRYAVRPRVHTFIATSDIHMQHKLRKSPEEVVRLAREMVLYARSLGCEDIDFSPEDAGRCV